MAILDAAAAADHDTSVLLWLTTTMGMDDAGAATVLLDSSARMAVDKESGNL
jgi:hypothetical protein